MFPWVNFINILGAAFRQADPESAKKTDNLTVYFVLSGSEGVKDAPKMLVKLTPAFTHLLLAFVSKSSITLNEIVNDVDT